MRGKVKAGWLFIIDGGITPAHAGKSDTYKVGTVANRDHPRACGEKFFVNSSAVSFFRITPAHAGKRNHVQMRMIQAGDHPRACGEKPAAGQIMHGEMGSPPRMRGKVM